jgi:hypothetical protein
VQFTRESIHASEADGRSLRDKFVHSEFLRDFRQLAQSSTRGCIVLERPDLLKELVERHGARDSTARGTALAELVAMEVRTSQYNPGNEIPEKNWLYRLAKRYWFYDFGVYRGHDHSRTAAPALLRQGNGDGGGSLRDRATRRGATVSAGMGREARCPPCCT